MKLIAVYDDVIISVDVTVILNVIKSWSVDFDNSVKMSFIARFNVDNDVIMINKVRFNFNNDAILINKVILMF